MSFGNFVSVKIHYISEIVMNFHCPTFTSFFNIVRLHGMRARCESRAMD